MHSVGIFDHQFPAVIFIRLREEKRRGKIGANSVSRAGNLPDSVVNVRTKRLAALVTVEQRWKNFRRQCRGNKEWILSERLQDHLADLLRRRAILRQLHVVLGSR